MLFLLNFILSCRNIRVSLEYLSPHDGFTWDRNLNANQLFFTLHSPRLFNPLIQFPEVFIKRLWYAVVKIHQDCRAKARLYCLNSFKPVFVVHLKGGTLLYFSSFFFWLFGDGCIQNCSNALGSKSVYSIQPDGSHNHTKTRSCQAVTKLVISKTLALVCSSISW